MGGGIMDRVDYAQLLQDLLPQGAAWPREPEAYLTVLLYALASELEEVDIRGQAMMYVIYGASSSLMHG